MRDCGALKRKQAIFVDAHRYVPGVHCHEEFIHARYLASTAIAWRCLQRFIHAVSSPFTAMTASSADSDSNCCKYSCLKTRSSLKAGTELHDLQTSREVVIEATSRNDRL